MSGSYPEGRAHSPASVHRRIPHRHVSPAASAALGERKGGANGNHRLDNPGTSRRDHRESDPPGDDPGGFIVTTLIGIAGAFIGGLITKALGFGDPIDEFFDLSTWLGAIIGSIVLLLIYRMIVGRGRSRTAY